MKGEAAFHWSNLLCLQWAGSGNQTGLE